MNPTTTNPEDAMTTTLPEEGCTRCACGCKYWDGDRCAGCGDRYRPEPATVSVSLNMDQLWVVLHALEAAAAEEKAKKRDSIRANDRRQAEWHADREDAARDLRSEFYSARFDLEHGTR